MVSDRLPAFLREAAGRTFVSWEFDCIFWLADWYMFATGLPDPIPEYRNVEMAKAAVGAFGFSLITQRLAKRAGLQRVIDFQPGDIGLLRNRPGNHVVGAIKTPLGWALLTPTKACRSGISVLVPQDATAVRVMAAWRIS